MLHTIKKTSSKSDIAGIFVSILCLIHCMVFPVLVSFGYLFHAPDQGHWHLWDVVFSVLAFWAVKVAASHSTSQFIKISFWITVSVFTLSILFHEWHDAVIYVSSLSSVILVVLHMVNFFLRSKCKVIKK